MGGQGDKGVQVWGHHDKAVLQNKWGSSLYEAEHAVAGKLCLAPLSEREWRACPCRLTSLAMEDAVRMVACPPPRVGASVSPLPTWVSFQITYRGLPQCSPIMKLKTHCNRKEIMELGVGVECNLPPPNFSSFQEA